MLALRWRKSKVFYRERSKLGVEWQIPGVERRQAGLSGFGKKLAASGELRCRSLTASSNKLRGALIILSAPRGVVGLKAKPRLEFDHTASQATRGEAKEGALNPGVIRAERKRLEVEFVEHVKEVAAELETGSFAEELEARQPELLADARVDIEIAWAAERVATDSRRTSVANIKKGRTLQGSIGGVTVKVLNQARKIGKRGNEIGVGSAPSRL